MSGFKVDEELTEKAYNPDQERDDSGKWTSGGLGNSVKHAATTAAGREGSNRSAERFDRGYIRFADHKDLGDAKAHASSAAERLKAMGFKTTDKPASYAPGARSRLEPGLSVEHGNLYHHALSTKAFTAEITVKDKRTAKLGPGQNYQVQIEVQPKG